tara:strand:+ start:224 stop:568 length:345 start_codon:yes stop_codon:yes gene_type:complete
MTNLSAVLTWKHPTTSWSIRDNVVVEFDGGVPSSETLASWTAEYEAAKPWEDLREERNRLLAETDWWSFSDSPTMTDAQTSYRQALRDLPATAPTPPVNDINAMENWPTWPTKP